ncbi:hypothetical protein CSC62_05705 [Pseudoxanthomonas jiangsuensis]|uniref:fimbrial biogenesis chaperone n=1 Tax=Pseudoxanthomonas jiangsuensis TaxID=619688 RepID=UPI001390D50F|nr:molecular chaperone [Pseudoxanthomonas jiangsuensis]KAF1698402.1 hypothetical protein CSC62_05705 [Pseudoxanthomonas jiangsuensis]
MDHAGTGPASRAQRPRPARGRLRGIGWLLAAGLAWTGPAAQAADLQVNPILVEFAPGERSQALWLTNTGTGTLRAQVRVSRWTQGDGGEQLEPSRDLVASPAILEVAAGEQQLVRLIRPQAAPLQAEAAYRLTVDELPHERERGQDPGLQFLLRYSIPAFVLAEGTGPLSPSRQTEARPDTRPALAASLQPHEAGSLLVVANPGRQRVRLSGLAWVDGQGQRTELVPGLLGYVLAGQQMQWPVPLPTATTARGGQLRVRFNDDASDQALPLDGAGR